MSERVDQRSAEILLALHEESPERPTEDGCACAQCLAIRDLLDSRARAKELEELIEEIRAKIVDEAMPVAAEWEKRTAMAETKARDLKKVLRRVEAERDSAWEKIAAAERALRGEEKR